LREKYRQSRFRLESAAQQSAWASLPGPHFTLPSTPLPAHLTTAALLDQLAADTAALAERYRKGTLKAGDAALVSVLLRVFGKNPS